MPVGDSETIQMIDTTALTPGSDFGPRYRIEALLGQGGMGRVYKAYDKDLDRVVALKVVRQGAMGETDALKRFKQELILASKISHKNILRIHDMGEVGGTKFITMAYVEGQDLHGILQDNPKLPMERILKFSIQLAEALAAAHAEGVVHRDLKPQNILVNKDDQIFVSDFGLAKSFEEGAIGMTRTGAFLGTPRYMSPEQVEGKPADQRSDLYAYGLILYEMVTGDVPFTGESTLKVMYQRIQEKPKSPKLVNPELPNWLVRIIMRCLEKDPAARYQSAYEILADLQGSKSSAGARSVQILIPEFARWRWAWITGGGVGVLLLLLGIQILVQRTHKTPAQHAPVSVLVADFTNHTDDPVFDGTLEPMFNVALEGASFINAYSRGTARRLAQKLPHPSDKLDEQAARLVAVGQGISAVITGELGRRGNNYSISATALDSVTGNVLAKTEVTAGDKDEVLVAIPKLAVPIRTALGDTTPESVQVEKARGALTASSLEAMHEYGVGIEQLNAGNMQEALQFFSKAIELDPNFARAYGSRAMVNVNLGKMQDAERDVKLAMEHVDRMSDRERYRVRGSYYIATHNWQKCVEEYGELVNQFPADNLAQLNLAACYLYLRNISKAVEAARRAVEIVPKGALQRAALSLYSSYAGDFASGEREAQAALAINQSFPSYLALAEAQLGLGQMSQAAETYHRLEKVNAPAASLAVTGLADIDLYEGRFREAIGKLEQGAAADLAAKDSDNAAEKFAALAHIQLLRGQKGAAVAAATKAAAMSEVIRVRVKAAQTLVEAGEISKAQQLASALASQSEPELQAYGAIVEGDLLLKRGDALGAVRKLTDANNLLDTWIGRYELGRAYLEVPRFVEADAEFDKCIKRRGEALELFMDNVPTFGYFPSVYYLQGRAREGLKSPGSAESYRTYLNIRGQAGEDPLLPEIRKRLGQ